MAKRICTQTNPCGTVGGSMPRIRCATLLRRRGFLSKGLTAVIFAVWPTVAHSQATADVNCDGRVSQQDLAALTNVLFDAASGCGASDVNLDGSVNAGDTVAMIETLNARLPAGPTVTFFGLAGASGVLLRPLGEIEGTPVYFRNAGRGFKVVIEAGIGLNRVEPGTATVDAAPMDPTRRPDLQIGSSTAIGDGSPEVCIGGVPAINAPYFQATQATADALNDLGCHFTAVDSPAFACTLDSFGNPGFADTETRIQFCTDVSASLEFPEGESLLTVRVRDRSEMLGPVRQLILRVGNGPAPPTFTPTKTPPSVTPRPTPSPSASKTASAERSSPTATRTSSTPPHDTTPSATASLTKSPTPTHMPTATPSPTSTQTPAAEDGPIITFFGMTYADDTLVPSKEATEDGLPIYKRPFGLHFSLVIEGKPGLAGANVGRFAGVSLPFFPDLQVQVNRPLGDGSADVCDRTGETPGGVPATDPPSFAPTAPIVAAVNDLACRFLDGTLSPIGREAIDACVQFDSGQFGFVGSESSIQFCAFVNQAFEFPAGDTLVSARLRDEGGNVGPVAQMIVRIEP